MAATMLFKFLLFSLRILPKRLKYPRPPYRRGNSHTPTSQLQKCPSLRAKCSSSSLEKLSDQTLVCDVEGSLLKSSSMFPYFMLVAFEAGGLFRAFVLLLLYPLVCCVSREIALKIMVMVSFFGMREKGFRVGKAVLAKYFLEDVRLEGYEVLKKSGRRVCVSEMPRVMVEGFLRDYLDVEVVLGRELKVVSGYYVGLMEAKENLVFGLEDEKMVGGVVGIGSFSWCFDKHIFSLCNEIYLVTEADKRNSHILPRDEYPRPLIFHDGRLAFRPTPLATLAMFIWVPFGFILSIFRILIAISLPHKIALPVLFFSGIRLRHKAPISSPSKPDKENPKGTLYVCNHRTLLDPLYLSTVLNKPTTAVTYSLSRLSEILAPIKTVRLSRNREEDRKKMEKLLRQGDLVVCPEGTTCREPFLLRFSPLFAELSDEIVPVAMDAHVSMFYGTTAGGLKCMDPFFFLMNPFPGYYVELLGKVPKVGPTCGGDGNSSIDLANFVQRELGKALGFECTGLSRRDKYLILAGNEGIVHEKKRG